MEQKEQTTSDKLAECLCEAAIKNFYILRHCLCLAVLTENFFMDVLDLELLQSKAGKQAIVDTHVEGIVEYIESLILPCHGKDNIIPSLPSTSTITISSEIKLAYLKIINSLLEITWLSFLYFLLLIKKILSSFLFHHSFV